uniref:Proline rich 12 n=1 Tax=Poecilia formosa TaxID=48698 RepID=A0A087X3X8_POEFO
SLLYGSSRSSHPDSELLHRQTYGSPHPLRAYATNHHPPGLSGLFDTSLHHASTSGPDPAVINLISALESRGPQATPSSSSLLSQFRTPSWQPTMHTPGPAELFISGAIPGSGSFPSSSSLSAYQCPGSFPGRSFTPSLSLQDAPTYSPTSNALLSPHDSLLHIKTPSQSSLGFDRLLSSQSATYRGSQESPALQNQISSDDTNCHLPSPQFNLLSSQLHSRHSQLCTSSMFSSSPALLGAAVPQSQSAPERIVSRQDSVIKHYQRSHPAQSPALHQYTSCGGSSRYQQLVSLHQNAGMPCSPLDEQSPSTDPKLSPQMEPQSYQPTIQTPYITSPSSSSVSSSSATKRPIGSSSNSGYSTSGSSSSSTRTAHTPPSASSSSSKANSISLPTCSHQQQGPQLAPAPPLLPVVSSSLVQQPALKQCLITYGSQSLVKSSTVMPNQTSPSPHVQSYSPTKVPSAHMAQSFLGFSSPHPEDLSSGRASSPLEYGNESSRAATQRGGIESVGSGSATLAVGNESNSSYHLPESNSPAAVCPSPSSGSSGGTKYLSSILSPAFMSSPESFPNTQQTQSNTYHSTPIKPKTDSKLFAADQSQVEEEETEDFLILHLLQTQRATPHRSQHQSHSQQLSQCISQARDSESKGMSFDISKLSNEHHHSQSVIRTNNSTDHSGSESMITKTANDLNRQLESTQKKQQIRSELTVSKSPAGEARQSQAPISLIDPPDPSQSTHVMQSAHSHTPCTEIDFQQVLTEPQQQRQPHNPLSQPGMIGTVGEARITEVESNSQNLSPQLPLPLQNQGHLQPHGMSANMAPPHHPQQAQQRQHETQLTHSRLDQLKQHQFDTITPANKVGLDQTQQQQRFPPLSSICFPDSLLQDEDSSFFPEVENMFCSSEYKGCGKSQKDVEDLKVGDQGYDLGNHHTDQVYGQYCHTLPGTGNDNLHLDLDFVKTHELPSTVNTDQLGLIQSQNHSIALSSAAQGDVSANKIMGAVVGSSSTTGLTSPIFCSSRPKKLLKTRSFHLLKQRRDPQPKTKKNYPQEYEFEDDEDKADAPADIRLNSRRLPDLLPDLVSSCGRATGLSPMTSDVDFCHPTTYTLIGHNSHILSHDGPKKRGRKPTKPKREGPPRPRGRPRIRPLPEPPYCRGLMGLATGETRRGRGRGRGRGRREEGLTDSLTSWEPVLSDGSVGSAPSLGMSPGPSGIMDIGRKDHDETQDNVMKQQHRAGKISEADDKDLDFKPGFMVSFLDFLKTGKKESDLMLEQDEVEQDVLDACSSPKGGIRPLSSSPSIPPPSPQPPPEDFNRDRQSEEGTELVLSGCPSPCKPLDEELKRNLETLPSFSSDEEDSVSKNQDLQKSISSAISALYDTPHSLAAVMASAIIKIQPTPSPLMPQGVSVSPPLPAGPPVVPTVENIKEESLAYGQQEIPDPPPEPLLGPVPSSQSPSVRCSPLTYSSSSPLPSSLPIQQGEDESASSPSPSSSEPLSPPTPEETQASQRLTSLHLAKKQADAAIAGESEEEDSGSGGEGIFRERDEFVVRTEDIGTLKMALQTGREPPPIWRVQKALLQKFSPEIKDGQRQFCATSNYLGYFGDAKMCYQRLYVKFLENVNKKDYVRVCSRKPWHRAGLALRFIIQLLEADERRSLCLSYSSIQLSNRRQSLTKQVQSIQSQNQSREGVQRTLNSRRNSSLEILRVKEEKRGGEKNKISKDRAEPPPKKRKKWLKEVPSSSSESDSSRPSDDEGPVWGGISIRAMREMFKSYVEMLVSTALDPDMIQALEDTDDELYLPPMRKIDSLLSEQKKRLLRRINMSVQHQQEVLHMYPKMTADPLESGAVRVHLGGEGYSRKTLSCVKKSVPKQQELRIAM